MTLPYQLQAGSNLTWVPSKSTALVLAGRVSHQNRAQSRREAGPPKFLSTLHGRLPLLRRVTDGSTCSLKHFPFSSQTHKLTA